METVVGMICVTIVILVKSYLTYRGEEQTRKEYFKNTEEEIDLWNRSPN